MEKDVNYTKKSLIDGTVGYGLFAHPSDLQPGDVIIRVNEPYVVTPESAVLTTHCYNCFAEKKLSRCSSCGVAHYCSSSCQSSSWRREHKNECKIFRRIQDQGRGVLPTPVRALLRNLLFNGTGMEPDPKWKDLESHQSEIMKNSEQKEKLILQSMMALKCTKLPAHTLELAFSILCRIVVNGFQLTLADDTPVGLCFDPLLASANHSCIPNAFISVDRRCVSLKALHPIKAGEEIRITYIDSTKPFIQREVALKSRYFFKCTCIRCQNDLSIYEVFLRSSVLKDNDSAMAGPVERLVKKANALLNNKDKAKPDWKDTTTLEEIRSIPESPQRLKALKAELERLDPSNILYSAVKHEIYMTYLQGQEYGAAFLVKVDIAFNHEPFEFPEPWHPVRVTSMVALYKLLKVASQDPDQDFRRLVAFPEHLQNKFQEFMTMIALLLMVRGYAPISHGAKSRFTLDAQSELEQMEKLAQASGDKQGLALIHLESIKDRDIVRVYFDTLEEIANPVITQSVIATVDLQGNGKRDINEVMRIS